MPTKVCAPGNHRDCFPGNGAGRRGSRCDGGGLDEQGPDQRRGNGPCQPHGGPEKSRVSAQDAHDDASLRSFHLPRHLSSATRLIRDTTLEHETHTTKLMAGLDPAIFLLRAPQPSRPPRSHSRILPMPRRSQAGRARQMTRKSYLGDACMPWRHAQLENCSERARWARIDFVDKRHN